MKLDELEKLEKEASEAPWHFTTCYGVATIETPGRHFSAHAVDYLKPDNASLIVESRNAFPKLLAVARAAREIIPAIENDCDSTMEQFDAKEKIKRALEDLDK